MDFISKAFVETAKEGTGKIAKELPEFAKDMEANVIKDFEAADKPLKIINAALEGKEHPETGVKFVKKEVEMADGRIIEEAFPEFPYDFEHNLEPYMYDASDKQQFADCNEALRESVENNQEFAEKFTDEQIDDIVFGFTPEGYTWHHSEETGVMQLVDKELHAKTGHTGGRAIWGGGKEFR